METFAMKAIFCLSGVLLCIFFFGLWGVLVVDESAKDGSAAIAFCIGLVGVACVFFAGRKE